MLSGREGRESSAVKPMPNMPAGCEEGIIRGMYKVSKKDVGNNRPHVQLFGSGAILREALLVAKETFAEMRAEGPATS